jgi:predicted metal-dependent hydrolase
VETRIVRSRRRRKTIQARLVDGTLEILAPARMSDADIQPYLERFKQRMERREAKARLDDSVLQARAAALNRQYFENRLRWKSIRWVTNQSKRFGSCTPSKGTIRVSHRVAAMPRFVQDYVILHELAHLAEASHSTRFWELVYRYPRTERARGYLMAAGLEGLQE